MVVAVLLIVLPGTAARLAVVTLIVVRLWAVLLVALRGRARPLLLLRVVPSAALVVIPVHARLVLGVLLLILIPASATGGALVCTLPVPALVIVSSTI